LTEIPPPTEWPVFRQFGQGACDDAPRPCGPGRRAWAGIDRGGIGGSGLWKLRSVPARSRPPRPGRSKRAARCSSRFHKPLLAGSTGRRGGRIAAGHNSESPDVPAFVDCGPGRSAADAGRTAGRAGVARSSPRGRGRARCRSRRGRGKRFLKGVRDSPRSGRGIDGEPSPYNRVDFPSISGTVARRRSAVETASLKRKADPAVKSARQPRQPRRRWGPSVFDFLPPGKKGRRVGPVARA
jgi:hypothetical protein